MYHLLCSHAYIVAFNGHVRALDLNSTNNVLIITSYISINIRRKKKPVKLMGRVPSALFSHLLLNISEDKWIHHLQKRNLSKNMTHTFVHNNLIKKL